MGKKVDGATVSSYCSPLRLLLNISPNREEQAARDLILHDPGFWQRPDRWWQYFKHEQGEGSNYRAFVSYSSSMAWKLRNMVKLTLGVWDESQIEQFQIRDRGRLMNLSAFDQEEHSMMIKTVGQQHTLFWQFFPLFGPFLTKAGEALNEEPIFVYDNCSSRAIAAATTKYEIFLLDGDEADAEAEAWQITKKLEEKKKAMTKKTGSREAAKRGRRADGD